jgi:hypothetical protein
LESGINDIWEVDTRRICKCVGEGLATSTYFFSEKFEKIRDKIITVTKITGRYFLNSGFRFEEHPLDAFVIKQRACTNPHCLCKGGRLYETRYFRFPASHVDAFRERVALIKDDTYDYEHQFYQKEVLPPGKVPIIHKLHVAGPLSSNGQFMYD